MAQKKWQDLTAKEKKTGIIGVIIVAIFLIGVVKAGHDTTNTISNTAASSNTSSSSDSQLKVKPIDPNAARDTAETTTPAPTPAPDTHPHFTNGTYKIGTDIQPGTYRTRVASPSCYYERMADFTGGINSILSNGNTDAPEVVTILPSDAGFSSKRCGTWTQDLSAITKSQTTFQDGTYIVGTDIQPGTYKSSGQTSCYWVRMADFTGGTNSILANDNTDTPAIVTITASDKGFHATRCGTWTLQP